MRVCVLVLVLIAISTSCDAGTNVLRLQKPLAFNVQSENGQLVNVLEKLKTWMKQGYTKPSIPVVDPYRKDQVVLNINNIFLRLIGKLDNPYSTGLSNFDVKQGEFDTTNRQALVNLRWDVVDLLAMYDVTSSQLPGTKMIFGKGAMVAIARGLEITVSLKIGQNIVNRLYVKDIDLKVTLDSMEFNASGLMNDELEGQELSKFISDNLPGMLSDHQDDVTYYASQSLKTILDQILGDLTYQDFIDLIQ